MVHSLFVNRPLTDRGAVVLAVSRAAIARALSIPTESASAADWLLEPGASFVTLTKGGHLRGCVGTVKAQRPLLYDLELNASAAALRDPRFQPVAANELQNIVIEVSLLSALEELRCASESDVVRELRPGIDGLLIEYRDRRGTFLPQVWGTLPEPEEFLAELKAKTSLPRAFWSHELKLWRYTVTKWKEGPLKAAA
jgi:AmmeMemoRadiSam system protein A